MTGGPHICAGLGRADRMDSLFCHDRMGLAREVDVAGSFSGGDQMSLKIENRPGALVGWTSQDLGDRIVLRLENVTTPPPHGRKDVQCATLLLNKQQAALLGEYLFKASGQTSPRRPGLIQRLFAN